MKPKTFFSLLTGLAAGAALGLLYAPDKGEKTRARVKKAAEDGIDSIPVDDAKESLKSLRETLKSKGEEIKEGTRDILLSQLDRLEKAIRKAEEYEAAEEAAEAAGTPVDEQEPAAPEDAE